MLRRMLSDSNTVRCPLHTGEVGTNTELAASAEQVSRGVDVQANGFGNH